MATRIVDSDAHVIEGQELMAELLARFPDKIRMARPDEEGAALVIEGRRYPNASGPGAGCHAKHGMGLGLVAIMVPAVLGTRNLDHRDLEPFYAAAQDLEMPLGIHGAPGIHLPPLGAERFDNYLQVHVVSFPFDMMVATTALVLGGVLERHPRLRVALLESGVGWVPYFFDRLDEHVEKRGRLTPECKREPREYLARGQLHVSCEPEESALPFVTATLGDHFVMYASDYPHWDSDFPNSTRGLREPTDLAPEFRVLHALSDDPLPSPPTPWFTRDPAVLERPFYVMERLPGEVPIPVARVDGSGPFDDAERAALGPEVAHALARLHAIDWRARGFPFLGAPPPRPD